MESQARTSTENRNWYRKLQTSGWNKIQLFRGQIYLAIYTYQALMSVVNVWKKYIYMALDINWGSAPHKWPRKWPRAGIVNLRGVSFIFLLLSPFSFFFSVCLFTRSIISPSASSPGNWRSGRYVLPFDLCFRILRSDGYSKPGVLAQWPSNIKFIIVDGVLYSISV